ncbi:MAG: thiolase family protein [Akkermansiaceae bacterium]|jgi:acetyl-CoA acetyltransferase family protein|nr:thiolase family protein [Akkermansiaceae bacterium]MDP4645827.1 thiolase family protein [Akkermansiaceae bacterium]MDP4779000.1 thiolase family protein [Akkermansiaceae bacterium]MDP4847996.1 thiolase family protein [Akkermansiaceae bacterium]MDP4896545.1 thiolase family protein [Akkermansiaceae bacterium]
MFIIAATRTPFCKMGTDLAPFTADDLGRAAAAALLTRTGIDPGELSEVIFGCVAQPAEAANIARIIALRAGVPQHIPAVTVHRNCASGMEAVTTAHQRIAAEQGDLFLVGGTESMSHVPLLFPHEAAVHFAELNRAKSSGQKISAAASFNLSDFKPRVGLELGLTDPFSGLIMGDTAEILSREFGITREQQDRFAANSHAKALAHREQLDSEITPLFHEGNAISQDNGIRTDSTPEKLATLRPIFDRATGTVTAGNSSQITDGAVALLVGTEEAANRLGIEPLGRLAAYAYSGCDPTRMGLGPVHAIARAKQLSGLTPDDADLVELNEAFAAQVLACLASLKNPSTHHLDLPAYDIPAEKLNRRGGSIALGHPVGATGARLILTALDQLRETGAHRALATLCIGGGQGAALYLERP